jgi:hypothetical protein
LTDVNDWLNPSSGSQAFEISNIQLLYDSYTIDEAVSASLMSALMRNKVMSIGTMNAYQVCYPLGAGASQNFSTVRAFSRIASLFITFRSNGPRTSQFICPGPLPGDATHTELAMQNTILPNCRVSLGPHNWPDPQPVSSMSEYYYMLTKALGHQQANITRHAFEHECFTIAFDFKKLPSDVTSAISTRSGESIFINLTNLGTPAGGTAATEMWVTIFSFNVLAIRESGVVLLS